MGEGREIRYQVFGVFTPVNSYYIFLSERKPRTMYGSWAGTQGPQLEDCFFSEI